MRNIDLIMNDLNKKYKDTIIQEGTKQTSIKKIPFSSPMANYMTYGGIPVGKITEFYGGEGGGKTTSALDICSNAQKLFYKEHMDSVQQLNRCLKECTNKKELLKLQNELDSLEEQGEKLVAYVDTEQTLDIEWAKLLGVDTNKLILVKPGEQTAEQILQIIIDIIKSGNIGLCVLDSIPCLVPQQIYTETLTIFYSKILPYLVQNECGFIGINQIREDISSMYNTISTPGGKAWKHACSLRLRFIKDSLLDTDNREISSRSENPAGNKVKMEISKTKVCKPDRRVGYYTLNYTTGIDVLADAVNVALYYGLIVKNGGWIKVLDNNGNVKIDDEGTTLQFNGVVKFTEYLNTHTKFKESFLDTLLKLVSKIE